MVGLGCSIISLGMMMSRGLYENRESVFEAGGDGGSMSMEMAMAGVRIWKLFRFCFGL